MADPADRFLARWSRRKRKTRQDRPAPGAEPERSDSDVISGAPGDLVEPPAENRPPAESAESEVVAQLPDIDDLDAQSDYSVFLKEGVPDAIRRKALRKLWRINPVLANLDGLNDYDEDFRDLGMVAETLKTAYKVGKGYLDEDEDVAGQAGEEEVAMAPADRAPDEDGGPEPDPPELDPPEVDPPELDPPERAGPDAAAPNSAPDATAEADEGAAEPTPQSGRSSRRSARERRWGNVTR